MSTSAGDHVAREAHGRLCVVLSASQWEFSFEDQRVMSEASADPRVQNFVKLKYTRGPGHHYT